MLSKTSLIKMSFIFIYVVFFINISASAEYVFNSEMSSEKKDFIEFKAAWVATVHNIDWPNSNSSSIKEQKNEFIQIVDNLKKWGFNAVIVQVRCAGDSLYESDYYPWSSVLTGVQGKDPGYDPLQFMISEAHKRNLEFHAWVNPFRATVSLDTDSLSEDHLYYTHPNWIVKYGSKYYIDPGVPEARRYIIDSIKEIVVNYDIDAIHMDDYFYPYPYVGEEFRDLPTMILYGEKYDNIADFRRNNINTFVSDLYTEIKKCKYYVKLGISPYGIWRNKSEDSTGSDTSASITLYNTLYADTRYWIEKGIVDYLMPQIYWNMDKKSVPFTNVSSFWAAETKYNENVRMYIGLASYLINSDDVWTSDEYISQLNLSRSYKTISGFGYYNYSSLEKFEDIYELSGGIKIPPADVNIDCTTPMCAVITGILSDANDVPQICFSISESSGIQYVVILKDGQPIETLRVSTGINVYSDVEGGDKCEYTVIGVDRSDNLSAPSSIIYIPEK